MRYALVLSFVAALLGGCASHKPEDFNGIWINQNAIDAAAKGGNLRQALQSNGPNLEWRINTAANQALVTSGFELSEAKLQPADKGWNAVFYPNYSIGLTLDGDELVQAASENDPEQRFHKADKPQLDAPPRTTFELALYEAYLKGDWSIVEGPGQGATMKFSPNGSLEGMPNLDRYALCLDGDCATMTQAACTAQGGTFRGVGTTCANAGCPQPTGACCFSGGFCLSLTQANCAGAGGSWAGAFTTCADNNGNGQADICEPPCIADFNGDGFVDFFDYDDYVNCFETGVCPPGTSADFNGDGFADFFDYDDFVRSFESGC